MVSFCSISISQGTATRDDIDTTFKLGMNHPMGPLQLGTSFVDVLVSSELIFDSIQLICT